jgi:F420-0:gamma-glutamyl ligase
MYGVNQAECCSGETAENCPVVVVPQLPAAARASATARGR